MEEDAGWQAVCLCAAWCGVCREWTPVFEALAASHPQVRFDWVDVEDEADALGDVDVETFPTLLIADRAAPRFFGPVQPSAVQVGKLLDRLLADPRSGSPVPTEAAPLLDRLRTRVLLKR